MKKTTLFGLCFSLLFLLNSCSQKKAQIDYLNISSDDKKNVVKQGYEHNRLVVNFPLSPQDEADIERKGFKKEKSCPCNPALSVWEYTGVGLIPEGDVKGKAVDAGGMSMVSKNYVVTDAISPLPQRDKKLPSQDGRINSQGGSKKSFRQLPTDNPVGPPVILTIIDSGVDYNNTTLQPSLHTNASGSTFCGPSNLEGRYGLNMRRVTPVNPHWLLPYFEPLEPIDRNGHGTFIAGIIAGKAKLELATSNTYTGYQGGDESVTIHQLHVNFVEKGTDNGFLFDALCGIHYAISKGSKVINASWRVLSDAQNVDEMNGFLPTLREASAKDILIVAGSGNDAINYDTDPRRAWPAAFSKILPNGSSSDTLADNILAVGAWNLDSAKISHFSNFGAKIVDIYAPGAQIRSFLPANLEGVGKGTSFATPYVARTAAILRGVMPDAKAGEIKISLINETKSQASGVSGANAIGLLQQNEAVQALKVRKYFVAQ